MKFDYLLDSITSAEFSQEPFKHLWCENFFSEEHFDLITNDVQIKRPIPPDTRKLIDDLREVGYKIQTFAG
jgi:hypothetical protein